MVGGVRPANGWTTAAAPERAFLVGVELRERPTRRIAEPEPAVTAQVAAARDAARTTKTVKGSLPTVGNRAQVPQFSADESLDELRTLARSAGAMIVGETMQRRDRPDPATLIGKGKLEEILGALASSEADVLLFDHDLTPTQQRNLERAVQCRVIDRTQLILDIFAKHARTREGQLQVELAQLEYLLPRLAGKGQGLSQQGGGIGTRGPGETKLETDKRRIRQRLDALKKQTENVRRVRAQQRQRREAVPVATVALVGYTNAGKSTLFNALTKAGVLESSRMFATLDPTIRGVALPSKRDVLLSDTVGFIRNLPHTLVSAFRATLEEVQRAALILQVSDAATPLSAEQDAQVDAVLCQLECETKPRLRVRNKVDLLPGEERTAVLAAQRAGVVPGLQSGLLSTETIYVSAVTGDGLADLLAAIDRRMEEDPVRRAKLRIPQSEGKALALLEAKAKVLSRKYVGAEVELVVKAAASVLRGVERWETAGFDPVEIAGVSLSQTVIDERRRGRRPLSRTTKIIQGTS